MKLRRHSHLFAFSLVGFLLWQDGKYVDVPMAKVDQVWVSQACEKKRACDALSARGKTSQVSVSKKEGLRGHPANDYCVSLGAQPRILIDSQKNRWNFCLFKDGSMIDSWALLKASKKEGK